MFFIEQNRNFKEVKKLKLYNLQSLQKPAAGYYNTDTF